MPKEGEKASEKYLKMSHLVARHPELLQQSLVFEMFKEDKDVIYRALVKDPLVCLTFVEKLKNNEELFQVYVREALISLALGSHSEDVQKQGQAIHVLAQKLLPRAEANQDSTNSSLHEV